MKTKEIEVYLHEGWEKSIYPEFSRHPNPRDSEFTVKAKLIIELPEKSVSITESQFDELLNSTMFGNYPTAHANIKQKLFGNAQ